MAKLSDRIRAETDNIRQVLEQMPSPHKFSKVSALELAGVATLLHNFYNFVHAYAFRLEKARILPLVKSIPQVWRSFQKSIQRFLD